MRAEIAQLRPEIAAAQAPVAAPEPVAIPAPAAPVAGGRGGSSRDAAEAALCVLKAALASERHRTSDLRAEIDVLQAALAAAEDRVDDLRAERDLWAGRARLLAQAMMREADGLAAAPSLGAAGPAGAHDTLAA